MNTRQKGRRLERKIRELCNLSADEALPRQYAAEPDVPPLLLASGVRLQFEAKKRKAIPAYVTGGLAQSRRYTPDAVPCVVIEQDRGEPIACLPLHWFVQLVGLQPLTLPAQPELPIGGGK